MKIKEPKNLNYVGQVVEIKTIVPLANRDKIVHAIIMGNNVITDVSTKVGDVGIYFPVETALSKEYLTVNNLYSHSELNANQTKKGYFDQNGRIRCIKMGGHPSEGLFMPMNSLSGLGIDISDLSIGDIFDELNNIPICAKYVIKKSQSQGLGKNSKSRNPKVSKLIDNQFKFHLDTAQLFRNTHRIMPNSLISISYKVHGCVSEESIVNTAEYGDKTIKEIVDNKINCHIKAYDVETKEIVYAPIDDHYLLKNDGEWFEIELENGVRLKITGNNPVWLPELNCYRKVSDLIENNVILFD